MNQKNYMSYTKSYKTTSSEANKNLINMHVLYEMIPCSDFREVQSVDADAGQNPLA